MKVCLKFHFAWKPVEKIKTDNAQVFADQLIEAVPVLEDGYDDDRTVLVASIWEKGHRNVE